MKRLPLPLIILLIIAHWCNYTQAQTPVLLVSNNPSTCNGSEGSFSFSGLIPNTTYQVTYNDDGVVTSPASITSNPAGQLTITGLNAGIYSNFIFNFNGSISSVLTGQQLSNPINVPLFTAFAPFCQGSTPPVLPATSNSPNSISGTWSPAVVNHQTSGIYTFTPAAGTCGTPVPINITVIPKVTATFPFGTSLTICQNEVPPVLLNLSDNTITGTWSPAVVDPTQSGTYVFTPTSAGCVEGTILTVTVNPIRTTSFPFGTSTTICEGAPVVTLSATSDNGITGTWSPAVVSNTASDTYRFTPNPGQCGTTTTYRVTVNPNITPTFPAVSPICAGTTLAPLPTTSINNLITGTWSPALDNTATTTYTFTPTAGLCATPTTLTITVNQKETPTFDAVAPICSGELLLPLPTTSTNGFTGTWAPALNNTATTTYTFTPTAGLCATTTTLTITVNAPITPTFNAVGPICSGAALPALPTTSNNGITGTWAPALDNTVTTTYTFTPAVGQCATTTTLTITVNPIVTPTFNAVAPVCAGATSPLPATSINGITGTWSPAFNNTDTTTYTFTPDAGQCATTATLTIAVIPNETPTFTAVAPFCAGGTAPVLPATSTNGIAGTWSPAVVSNTSSGTHLFTPDIGVCATTVTYNVIVTQKTIPDFSFGTSASVCIGDTVPVLPAVSTNGINGTWSPAVVSSTTNGTYTFTPDAGQCATTSIFTWQVNPIPALTDIIRDTAVYDGTVLAPYNFTINNPAGNIRWANSNTLIGLAASGTGMIPTFTATNMTDTALTAIITTIPFINGCSGTSQSYRITVLPLAKDIFVPNIFSPNGDGKNEQLLVYGNYILSVEMHIFNQWGQRLVTLTSTNQGWDGKYKGTAQPVGVYMYALKAVLKDGRKVSSRGSVTLIR